MQEYSFVHKIQAEASIWLKKSGCRGSVFKNGGSVSPKKIHRRRHVGDVAQD